MEIKTVKFRKEGFYTQPFVMGGEEGPDKFDRNIRYRGSLQNYLIDTGSEVILVDTGLPAGTPEEAPDENSLAFTGKDICSYMEAFAALGYKPEQVTKIQLHRRPVLQLPRQSENPRRHLPHQSQRAHQRQQHHRGGERRLVLYASWRHHLRGRSVV